jgi:hypothetical protein
MQPWVGFTKHSEPRRSREPVSGVQLYVVSKSTGAQQTSSLDRHHPTRTLETMRFGVSNVPGGLLGLRYRKWKVGHLGLAACRVKLLQGARPTAQRAHALAAPATKLDPTFRPLSRNRDIFPEFTRILVDRKM